MKQKGLKCHPTKSVCIIIGNKKYRTEAKKEIEDDPVMFGDFMMKFVENEVYLGDVISSQGMEDSVLLTLEKRTPKINGGMCEAKAIIEDFRMQAMGGMAGAWDLFLPPFYPPARSKNPGHAGMMDCENRENREGGQGDLPGRGPRGRDEEVHS
jgi:hypothetical protein